MQHQGRPTKQTKSGGGGRSFLCYAVRSLAGKQVGKHCLVGKYCLDGKNHFFLEACCSFLSLSRCCLHLEELSLSLSCFEVLFLFAPLLPPPVLLAVSCCSPPPFPVCSSFFPLTLSFVFLPPTLSPLLAVVCSSSSLLMEALSFSLVLVLAIFFNMSTLLLDAFHVTTRNIDLFAYAHFGERRTKWLAK